METAGRHGTDGPDEPVVVGVAEVDGEPGVLEAGRTDDQPPEQHLLIDPLPIHVDQSHHRIGRTLCAGGRRGRVDRHPAAASDLAGIRAALDLRHPLPA